jgi:hypothetical protein
MAETRKAQKPKKRKPVELEKESALSSDRQKKLRELDDLIDQVLQEAGEDFLQEFKQVEGQ